MMETIRETNRRLATQEDQKEEWHYWLMIGGRLSAQRT